VTQLDLSLADNKVAMLGQLNGCIQEVIVLPADYKAYGAALEDRLLREALLKLAARVPWTRQKIVKDSPGVLSEHIKKDIIIIRSLALLYDGPDWKNLFPTLTKGLPRPPLSGVLYRTPVEPDSWLREWGYQKGGS
jgi:hypothetical protein